jgi:hypothetical protein
VRLTLVRLLERWKDERQHERRDRQYGDRRAPEDAAVARVPSEKLAELYGDGKPS